MLAEGTGKGVHNILTWDWEFSLSLQESRVCIDELLRLRTHRISIIPSAEVFRPPRACSFICIICIFFEIEGGRIRRLRFEFAQSLRPPSSDSISYLPVLRILTSTSRTEMPPTMIAVGFVRGGNLAKLSSLSVVSRKSAQSRDANFSWASLRLGRETRIRDLASTRDCELFVSIVCHELCENEGLLIIHV